jgi:hypothetical protein
MNVITISIIIGTLITFLLSIIKTKNVIDFNSIFLRIFIFMFLTFTSFTILYTINDHNVKYLKEFESHHYNIKYIYYESTNYKKVEFNINKKDVVYKCILSYKENIKFEPFYYNFKIIDIDGNVVFMNLFNSNRNKFNRILKTFNLNHYINEV